MKLNILTLALCLAIPVAVIAGPAVPVSKGEVHFEYVTAFDAAVTIEATDYSWKLSNGPGSPATVELQIEITNESFEKIESVRLSAAIFRFPADNVSHTLRTVGRKSFSLDVSIEPYSTAVVTQSLDIGILAGDRILLLPEAAALENSFWTLTSKDNIFTVYDVYKEEGSYLEPGDFSLVFPPLRVGTEPGGGGGNGATCENCQDARDGCKNLCDGGVKSFSCSTSADGVCSSSCECFPKPPIFPGGGGDNQR